MLLIFSQFSGKTDAEAAEAFCAHIKATHDAFNVNKVIKIRTERSRKQKLFLKRVWDLIMGGGAFIPTALKAELISDEVTPELRPPKKSGRIG